MMVPVQFPEANTTLHAPEGQEDQVNSLPCFRDGTYLVSCWQLSWRARLRALWSGKVWLMVMSRTQPPVTLTTEVPITREL